MVEKPKKERRIPISTLAKHPAHVQAIGMISIELANLEIHLAELLAAVLNIENSVGHAIYFTPRANRLRIDLLDAVISTLSNAKPAERKKVLHFTKRAQAIFNKRHEYIHNAWAVTHDAEVLRGKLPLSGAEGKLVPLTELQTTVMDIRRLMMEIGEAIPEIHDRLWPPSSDEKSGR